MRRAWRDGDTVALALPKALRLEPLRDNPHRTAILWGPLVLAGDLGPEPDAPRSEPATAPVFFAAERPVAAWLKPVAGRAGAFRSDGVGRDRDVEFVPFYRLHRRTYAVYCDLFTPAEWQRRADDYAAAEAKRRRLEGASVAFVQPGEM